jgi:tether containing UBX domain for GLUT4
MLELQHTHALISSVFDNTEHVPFIIIMAENVCRKQHESEAKAAAIGHATIRLLLPADMIVQCSFDPNEALRELYAFVEHAVLQPRFAQVFSLFTTPPRQMLSTMDATFWEMGLVPGAYVHVSIDDDCLPRSLTEQSNPMEMCTHLVRNGVLAMKVSVAPGLPRSEQKAIKENVVQGPRKMGGEFLASSSTKVAASGIKTPKWLKLK